MDNVLEYKGYWTVINYSAEDKCLYGKIEGINDLVSFGCESADEINECFRSAVDEYLEDCKRYGKEPDKAYKGSFNVRISPELHREASMLATKQGITLNQFIANATQYAVSHA